MIYTQKQSHNKDLIQNYKIKWEHQQTMHKQATAESPTTKATGGLSAESSPKIMQLLKHTKMFSLHGGFLNVLYYQREIVKSNYHTVTYQSKFMTLNS